MLGKHLLAAMYLFGKIAGKIDSLYYRYLLNCKIYEDAQSLLLPGFPVLCHYTGTSFLLSRRLVLPVANNELLYDRNYYQLAIGIMT